MKVTEEDVAYVADLANLELSEDERARMVRDLNSILGHVDTLSALDTKMSRRWRRFPTATGSTSPSREASVSLMPAAKISTKDCENRCRTMSR